MENKGHVEMDYLIRMAQVCKWYVNSAIIIGPL